MNITRTDKSFIVFSLEADRDYLLSRLINFSGNSFASRAGYLGQQAIEKYLKALMVQEEGQYLKMHDLIELADFCSKYDSIFNEQEFIEKLKVFDDFREVGRYGGEADYDPHAKKESNFETAGVYFWDSTNIKILDEIVHVLRVKLDFKVVNGSDSLEAIVNDDKRDALVSQWSLPIKLKEILVTRNDYWE